MSAPRIGTAAADKAVYSGRECIGYVRGSTAGCYAYTVGGKPIGTFGDRKAAVAAIMARAMAGKAVTP